MSDYVREKVLRIPVTLEELGVDDIYDAESKHAELFNYHMKNSDYFQISPTTNLFLDYVLEHKYGADGEYGKVRDLYDSEKAKYLPIFQQILKNVDIKKVRLVEYCWYNCSEAPNYYDYADDSFYNEV